MRYRVFGTTAWTELSLAGDVLSTTLGALPVNGIWLVLIGSFLYQSAHAAYRQAPAAGLAAHVGMTVGQVTTP